LYIFPYFLHEYTYALLLKIIGGSRGSFAAAVTAVAAALKGVDMVVNGNCVNAFCATRPPGHHAGRDLHPMNAVSNGFCILNAAASAALYAASPRSQGGLGLKRVCVIDIDVHHGNGTQDILCSTYDPRFLYISTHAGGAHVNGFQNEDDADADHTIFRRGSLNSNDGIFPGKCGDVSPHPGVLNIPLGTKVTPSDLGTAIVTRVTPAVETFDPDLIIVSAGFDAHVNDPLGMGGLSAQDYGTVTSVICQMALRCCSGRVLSVLEGGYGVPCCKRIDDDLFLPKGDGQSAQKILDLGDDLPQNMEDSIDPLLRTKLDKCHQEGFLQCVQSHVSNLNLYNNTEGNKNVHSEY
jgi:acetoin utilization deacetylase AcuC-like enzyme